MMQAALLRAHAEAAPGSMWAFDYLAHAWEAYERRDENGYATLQHAARLCGHEGGPCIAWAARRLKAWGLCASSELFAALCRADRLALAA